MEREERDWGSCTVLDENRRYRIKRLELKKGGQLSLHRHHHRSEHWIVVSGTAKVVSGDLVRVVYINETVFVPAGVTHRLENLGIIPLVMIEVQSGEYLGEDDIV